jgi:subtilisin family serine protease
MLIPAGRPRRTRRQDRRRRGRACAATLVVVAVVQAVALAFAGPADADIVRSTETWVLNELNLPAAWQVTQGKGVVVAVIDSGVDPNVSDLTGQVRSGPDYTGVNTPPSNPHWGQHGTWMASLIAGHGHGPGGQDGIIGSAPAATILSIRVITDANDPNFAAYERQSASHGQLELAKGIKYAVAHGAGVISMSLGYTQPSAPVRAALQDAYDHNVVVVASAGNSGDPAGAEGTGHAPYSYPANYPGVLTVAAVNSAGQVASFSSENLSVQVAAPGYQVPAQGRDGLYWLVSGTSPACALTAGVVALIKSAYPGLSDSQVISAITSSTTRSTRPPGGWDEQIGFGVVNAAAALAAAARLNRQPLPSAGLAAARHFGGGIGAIPPAPVSPRGPAALILYCLLGAACLALVALATSKLFGLHEAAESGRTAPEAAGPAGPPDSMRTWRGPAARGAAGQPAPPRHAAPRGRGGDPAGPS